MSRKGGGESLEWRGWFTLYGQAPITTKTTIGTDPSFIPGSYDLYYPEVTRDDIEEAIKRHAEPTLEEVGTWPDSPRDVHLKSLCLNLTSDCKTLSKSVRNLRVTSMLTSSVTLQTLLSLSSPSSLPSSDLSLSSLVRSLSPSLPSSLPLSPPPPPPSTHPFSLSLSF